MRTTRKQFPVNWLTSGRLAFTIQRASVLLLAFDQGSHFFSFIDPPWPWRAESSGSQPGYRKLFPHGPHSSNFFEIKISQRRDSETPSLSY